MSELGGTSPSKVALRSRMRRVRAAIAPGPREARAEELMRRLLALAEVESASTVMAFYSFGSEVPTRRIVERLAGAGHRVLLPYLHDDVMEAAEVRPGDSLAPTGYGPKEPLRRVAARPEEIDVVIAPGLAFDRGGGRLGYGGGHYDRFLRRAGGRAVRIGIAFDEQLVDHVPVEAGDERVHMVVTDRRTVRCDPEQAPPVERGGPGGRPRRRG